MGAELGSAKRARKLARLFEAWRRAFDTQDHAAMQSARRAIDAVAIGDAQPLLQKYLAHRSDQHIVQPTGGDCAYTETVHRERPKLP